MKDQAIRGKYSIFMINNLPESKRACDSSWTFEGPAVSLFKTFVKGTALADIWRRVTLSSYDSNDHESRITSYLRIVSKRLGYYAYDPVVTKSDDKIC